MGSPERSSTVVCGTAQLMRLSIGVVLPEVSTPFAFLHTVSAEEEYREPVHNHDAREVDVKNVRGVCHREGLSSMRFVV